MIRSIPILQRVRGPAVVDEIRRELAERLADMLPVMRALAADEAVDAAEMVLMLLHSPARLNVRFLLPLVAELSERIADFFEQRAAEFAGDELGEELLIAAALSLDEAAAVRGFIVEDGGRAHEV